MPTPPRSNAHDIPRPQRATALRIVKIAFGGAVAAFVAYALITQWGELTTAAAAARPRWSLLALSALLVLANYALLIGAWRVVLGGWEGRMRIGYWESARIWTISNLGRYVPGKVWAMGSMALMVQEHGISGVAAVGSSILIMLINTVAGFVVLAATGAPVLHVPTAGTVAIIAIGAGVLLSPQLLPWLGGVAAKLTKREIAIPRLPHRAIWIAALISAASWVVYGLAFRVLVGGVLGRAPGALGFYVAVFTGSYLIGFLALIVPGGIGVREVVMGTALRQAGFTTGEAVLLVVASRVWLTILEILPALLFLAHRWVRGQRPHGSTEITQ